MEFEKLQDIISQVLGVGAEEITPEASFTDDLGADSLEIFQIIMGIEDEFGIEIPSHEAETVVTVSDAFERIKEAV
ncbi:MAG TPA: acyl carrier protein [Candidatus Eubacterium avistercoris]|uniref:Acyl carrier protein n=1 Tax=Candidatus Eubacterium avistercoris TaxID=2838567 RepID=A0A9D2D4Z5_9FIRM|nr:acyl carrier protein [Candidatus Eubacterium avistercoris]